MGTYGYFPSLESSIKIFQIQQPSVLDYVNTLIERQGRLIDAAIQSQNETNDANLRRRYSHYLRSPKLRQHVFSGYEDSVIETTHPIPVSHTIIYPVPSRAPIISAVK